MGSYLNPSNDNFIRALNSEIYVDKTDLIRYTNKVINTQQQNICVSRPRRFGNLWRQTCFQHITAGDAGLRSFSEI